MPSRTDCLEAESAAGAILPARCGALGATVRGELGIRPITRRSRTGSRWAVSPAAVTAAASLLEGPPAGTPSDRSESMRLAGASSGPQRLGAPT